MPPFPPGEARRLIALRRLARRALVAATLVAVSSSALDACSAGDLHDRARRDDAAYGTHVFTWTDDHDPARLDVWHLGAATVATYLRNGHARALDGSVEAACRDARRDRALLLVVAPERSAARSRALDCGFAVERDRFAVVIAPR